MSGRRGSALAITLVVLVFASILGAALLRTSAQGKLLSSKEAAGAQAYYVAESALWRVFSNPNLIPSSLFQTGKATIDGLFDEGSKSYSVVIEELPAAGDNMYLASAYGSTPYSQRLAAATVEIRSMADVLDGAAFHLGGMSLTGVQSSVPNFSSTTGNERAVKHHFSGSDVIVYGSIELQLADKNNPDNDRDDPPPGKTEYYRHAYDSFNIWPGGDDSLGHQFVLEDSTCLDAYAKHPLFYWDEDHRPANPSLMEYPEGWLAGKYRDAAEPLGSIPDLSISIRDSLLNQMEGGEWHDPLATPNDLSGYVLVGEGDLVEAARRFKNNQEPDPGWEYSPTRVRLDAIDKSITIVGSGALHVSELDGNSTELVIDNIHLVGDLFIIGEGDFDIRIKYVNCREFRLVVISERSLRLGNAANDWSPYPPGSTPQLFYLGADSALWARQDLVIMGALRPDDAFGRADAYGPVVFFDYEAQALVSDNVHEWPMITLVSKLGSLRYQYLKSSGLVYAGNNIEAFRTRLHGVFIVRDPFRVGNRNWIGLHQLNLSTDPSFASLTATIGIPDIFIQVKSITR